MFWKYVIMLLLLITTWVSCHPASPADNLQNLLKVNERLRRSLNTENPSKYDKQVMPFSPRRLEKMLEKAILKIITGDLANADMLLLKSLNYSLEEVLAIRERELGKKFNHEEHLEMEKVHSREIVESKMMAKKVPVMDYEAYNKKAVEDYEMIANKMEVDGIDDLDYNDPIAEEKRIQEKINHDFHTNFDRAMEPHVVFKIRYDDSAIDSGSFEKSKEHVVIDNVMNGMRIVGKTSSSSSSSSSTSRSHAWKPSEDSSVTSLPIVYQLANVSNSSANDYDVDPSMTPDFESSTIGDMIFNNISDTNDLENEMVALGIKRISEYEGLEWVEDDVYRVIPEALNYDLNNYEEENKTMEAVYQSGNLSIEEMMSNDYSGYQEDLKDMENGTRDQVVGNFSAYQQLAVARRRDQAQNAIEDIKLRVLALTGRFNLSANSNQVPRERLTMFSPTCQIPKNTDTETWSDLLSMNMHFQMNVTSSDHIVAARLRIYKLPQTNLTVPSSSDPPLEDEEEEEKKIRISVYFYTKSLKKHRSKKRLMDSVVTPLTPGGGHLALDVRQALRFWRQPSRTTHSTSNNNHGLLVQVEDQDGRPLKPTLYIQQDDCHSNDEDTDEKAYQRVPAIFLQACARYVRVVNGEAVAYVNCKNLKNSQH